MTRLLRLYLNRRMLAMLMVGFASGLPFGLLGDVLKGWLTDGKADLKTIGWFTAVSLPYALKFIWAPLLDRYVPPFLGRRRGWLVITQGLMVPVLLLMAWIGHSEMPNAATPGALVGLAMIASLLALLSATQDIAADAYRTELLPTEEKGAGTAVYVNGYRIAFLASTGLSFFMVGSHLLSWPGVYVGAAILMGLVMFCTMLCPEPVRPSHLPRTLSQTVVEPFAEFVSRHRWWLILLFIILFKLPEELLLSMKIPFLQEYLQYDKKTIALVAQSWGLGMVVAGAFIGGTLTAYLGMRRSLWLIIMLQGVCNLSYLLPILFRGQGAHPGWQILAVTVSIENICTGMVTAAFIAFLMTQCDRRFSGTHYALLSGLMRLTSVTVASFTGHIIEHIGWSWFIAGSAICAIAPLSLLPWIPLKDHAAPPAEPEPTAFPVICNSNAAQDSETPSA